MKLTDQSAARINKLRNISLATGIVMTGLSVFVPGLFKESFAVSYLIAFMYWLGLAIGALPLISFHSFTGGNWGMATRRIFEIASKLTVLMALLFIPIIIQRHDLYIWMDPAVVAHDPILQHKAPYLNTPFFLIRAGIYFVLWILFAFIFNAASRIIDERGGEQFPRFFQAAGSAGLILYCLTTTFACVDWVMSLEPHWFSTMYGAIFIVGNGLSAMVLAIIVTSSLSNENPLKKVLSVKRLHDLGSLTCAFVLLWAYTTLSQFLIIWSANLQEEAPWYLHRFEGGWFKWGIFIVLFHFLIPFLALIIRNVKRNFRALRAIACVILIMRYCDIYWYIKPAFSKHLTFSIGDIVTWLAIGGLWLGIFFHLLARESVCLKNDPIWKE